MSGHPRRRPRANSTDAHSAWAEHHQIDMNSGIHNLALLALLAGLFADASSGGAAPGRSRGPLTVSAEELVEIAARSVAEAGAGGVQILIGRDGEVSFSGSWGRRSLSDSRPVDSETRFCIGSCSKPFASTVLLALDERGKLRLDRSIDAWLPEFSHRRLAGGGVVSRAPTLVELLSHRGGIYSQKRGITRAQAAPLYRSFDQSLERNVGRMARFAYIAEPGSLYAYSGAGYCVLGRAAEVATRQPFEQLLAEIICRPLGLKQTSYFPKRTGDNIAEGAMAGREGLKPDAGAPHRAAPHVMPLVGGSLYATATDVGRFARMIAAGGELDGVRVLSAEALARALRPAVDGSKYGLGWVISRDAAGRIVAVSHSGSLASYRALLKIHLPTQSYLVMLRSIVVGAPGRTDDASLSAAVQAYFDDFIR